MSKTEKVISQVTLVGTPPRLREIFNLLQGAGARHYALFGGAPRDADWEVRNQTPRLINDYDLRVWFDQNNFDHECAHFIDGLNAISQQPVRVEASAGTGRPLYRLTHEGVDLDISIRSRESLSLSLLESVAIDRAGDADIGISSVAIDPLMRAWATKEYVADQENKTLSLYPIEDEARRTAYSTRMQAKFPDHTLINV